MKEQLIGNRKGQAIFEVVIAMAILVSSFVGFVTLIFGSQKAGVDSQEQNRAIQFNKQSSEYSFASSRDVFNNLVGTTSIKEEFFSSTTVKDIDAYTKEVEDKITWDTDPFINQETSFVTIVTNWKYLQSLGGDTGGTLPTGNWNNPRTLGSVDLGAGESATDLDVINKLIYMTSIASAEAKQDFFVIDASDPQNPVIVGAINTGTGLNAVDAISGYAFVVGKDDTAELQVINISSPTAPVKVASLDLSGDADALSVFYYDNHLYIGRADDEPEELVVVNVSNPLSPVYVSGLSGIGGKVNKIFGLEDTLYVATESVSNGLYVINSSNPSFLQSLGSYNSGGSPAYSVFAVNSSLVFVGAKKDFYIANATNTGNIQTVSSKTIVGSGVKIVDINVAWPYAFFATEDSTKEFQVLNVSNPLSPSTISTFNFPNIASGIDYENNLVYVSVKSNDSLRIITSQ